MATLLPVGEGPPAAAALRRAVGPGDGVVILGFAGGLDPLLRPGDLVLADRLVSGGGRPPLVIPADLRTTAERALRSAPLPFTQGALLTSVQPILEPAGKSAAWRSSGALAVDLESYWLAEAALDMGLPFVVVRAIVDAASHRIPGYLAPLGDKPLRHQLSAIAGGLLRRPLDTAAVFRLARSSRLACARVGLFLEAFLDAL